MDILIARRFFAWMLWFNNMLVALILVLGILLSALANIDCPPITLMDVKDTKMRIGHIRRNFICLLLFPHCLAQWLAQSKHSADLCWTTKELRIIKAVCLRELGCFHYLRHCVDLKLFEYLDFIVCLDTYLPTYTRI